MKVNEYRARRVWQFAVFFLLVGLATSSAFGQNTPKPSAIMDQYRAQRITWTTNIWPYANTLFGILATIEFTWSAAVMLLEKHDLQSWTSALIRKMMWIGAFYALLLNGRTWIPAIIDSFEQIGQTASGFNQIAPSDVFAQGIDIAGALMATSSTSAFFQNLGTSLAMVITAAITALAFTGITIQFIVAMVESYIIVAAGFIFLGFGGSRWTAPYTERYIGLSVSVGLKIMLLYLLIGTGMSLSVDWMTDAQKISTAANPAMSAFEIMGASLIFLMLCWQIPKLFSAVLGGAPALTGGDLISTGTGLVAGAATVASLGAGAAALTARGTAAIAGVSTAANAGAGASSAIAGFGAANRGGGTVPPPSNPGPSSNGRPKQPDPPTRDSGGAAADVAGVRSNGSTGAPALATPNGSQKSHLSGGNAVRVDVGPPSERAALSSVGGESLVGSGFENERPANGFGRTSLPVGSIPAISSTSASPSSDDTPASVPDELPGTPSRQGTVSEVQSTRSAATSRHAQSPLSPRVRQSGRTADQVLTDAARRLKQLGNRVQTLPRSDAAPHTTPPRMPIEHEE